MSSRRKPGSSNNLNCLDSGFHRNDDIALMQRFLNSTESITSERIVTCYLAAPWHELSNTTARVTVGSDGCSAVLVGCTQARRPKSPLKLKELWAISIRLQLAARIRDLALINLAIDSKLRACDLVNLRVRDIAHGDRVTTGATVMQQKTQRPVQFEIAEPTRDVVTNWISHAGPKTACFRAA